MNYAFKMMAVVLVLGMLLLHGCQTTNNHSVHSSDSPDYKSMFLKINKNLDTETSNIECLFAFANKIRCETKRMSSIELCTFLRHKNNKKTKYIKRFKEVLNEVKYRKLNCGESVNKNKIVTLKSRR